jgi:hypothetical protein
LTHDVSHHRTDRDRAVNLRFHEEDWERIERDWTLFWNGELQRPLVWFTCYDPATGPSPQKRKFIPQYGAETSPQDIIAIETEDLEKRHFPGDTFPKFWLNFGAGSLAAYLGSEVIATEDTVWFDRLGKELDEIEIAVDRENYWYQRIQAVLDAALSTWNGAVQVGFSDIGGNLDIIASLRGTNELLLDVSDHPEVLDRLVQEVTTAWIEIYQEEAQRIRAICRGTAPWGPLWSKGTTAFLQSDFSYMISPKMFEILSNVVDWHAISGEYPRNGHE